MDSFPGYKIMGNLLEGWEFKWEVAEGMGDIVLGSGVTAKGFIGWRTRVQHGWDSLRAAS
jgi:hypothetical protein